MTQETTFIEQPKPLGALFKWIRVFFIIYIVGEVLLALGNGLILGMGSSMFGPGQPISIGDYISIVGGVLLLFSYIVCVVLFCIFSYRAVKNLNLLGTKHVDITPGWAVGWYFIPIANLWKPYGAMSKMWTGSVHADDPYAETPSIMLIWWICWIITTIAGRVSWRMGIEAGAFDEYASDLPLYKITLMIDILSAVTGIIAAWLLLRLCRAITEAQHLRMNVDAFS